MPKESKKELATILKEQELDPELIDKLTRTNAMLSKCHGCVAFYADGKEDCEVPYCPHYYWMPYRKRTPNFEWLAINPKKKGQVTWEDSKRDLSDEQRVALSERLKKARSKNGKG